MVGKLTLAAGLLAVGLMAGTQLAAAAPMPQSSIVSPHASASLVQKAQYWGYCRSWRRECAARWGWRTGRYFRCLARRGC